MITPFAYAIAEISSSRVLVMMLHEFNSVLSD